MDEAESQGKIFHSSLIGVREISEASCHWKEHAGLPICFSNCGFTQIDLGEGDVILPFFQLFLACMTDIAFFKNPGSGSKGIADQPLLF